MMLDFVAKFTSTPASSSTPQIEEPSRQLKKSKSKKFATVGVAVGIGHCPALAQRADEIDNVDQSEIMDTADLPSDSPFTPPASSITTSLYDKVQSRNRNDPLSKQLGGFCCLAFLFVFLFLFCVSCCLFLPLCSVVYLGSFSFFLLVLGCFTSMEL